MSAPVHRRRFLAQLAAAAAATAAVATAALPAVAFGAPRRRRVLCFTKSAGWEHSVVKREAGGAPSLVERTLTAMATREGFDVVCTKDGGVFTPDGLRGYDALFFFTTGDLTTPGTDGQPPMPAGGKQALLDAVRGGKGFVGVHSATDTFHTARPPGTPATTPTAPGTLDPYLAMLGAEFIIHGAQQAAPLRTVDGAFPGARGFASGAPRMGEWYSLRDFAPDLHVVQVLETAEMTGAPYARGAYPVTWARRHGAGRVFYTALGHREEEWADPALLGLLLGAIRWATGDIAAAIPPNLAAAAPRSADLPPATP